MRGKTSVLCSACGETTTFPEYSTSGLPYPYFECDCGEGTKLNPRRMSPFGWEIAWRELVGIIRKEFGDAVADRLVKYIIEKRNHYLKDEDYLRYCFEPQSLKEVKE